MGYDIMEGNPFHKTQDPGFRAQIFEPTKKNKQNKYVLHDGIEFRQPNFCDKKMKKEVFSNSNEYR